ncbi:MAG: hypothetical protein AAF236_10490, partial [Verrucomicrobiota bacterium]
SEIPAGFSLDQNDDREVRITHKQPGVRYLILFFTVWILGWSVGCFFLGSVYLSGRTVEGGESIPLWLVIVFFLADGFVIVFLLHFIFAKTQFLVGREQLIVEKRSFLIRRIRSIPRDTIQQLIEVEDRFAGDDEVRKWLLKIKAVEPTTLLARQPRESTSWLGGFLADWADIPLSEKTANAKTG